MVVNHYLGIAYIHQSIMEITWYLINEVHFMVLLYEKLVL